MRSLRPTRPGAAGKRSNRRRTTAFEYLEERCCLSTVDIWIGGATGNYSNTANWSLGVVPNNGNSYNGQPATFTVEIANKSAVTLDIPATIDNLTIDPTSSLSIANGQFLAVVESGPTTGTIDNEGTINVGSSSAVANLYAEGTTANGGTINLSGGGTINLNNANSYLRGYNGNETLINVDNTIQGQGYILPTGLVPEPGDCRHQQRLGRDAVDLRRSYHQHRDARGHRRRHAPDLRLDRHQHRAHDLDRQHLEPRPQRRNPRRRQPHRRQPRRDPRHRRHHAQRRDHRLGHDLLDRRRQQQLPHRRSGQPGNDQRRVQQRRANLYADLNAGTINLSGGGTINLNNANSYLRGYNGNETLINVDNTIQGQGYFYQLGRSRTRGLSTPTTPRAGRCRSTPFLPPTPGRSRPPAAARSRSTPRPSPTPGTRSRPTAPRTSSSTPQPSTAATSPPPAPP